ncbi:urea ABC transporter permease subunit UrtC [Nesterenkonia xinjiangensis]|uniref:Urea transport system permease protein n=2 Tax=Nesterenkonia xinjiangensis TaxID=225327 RepID=A0A7Z0GLA9_9MICC|nr:urea ABC transporter permease subunit UrtC [Nesterenkonia xinjiangensis]NYJ77236.1 urea transport system permease protein [Nesterenkonia xinjiangensis]
MTTITPAERGTLARIRRVGAGPDLPRPSRAFLGIGLLAVGLMVLAPMLLTDFRLNQLGRFICYAIVAVGIGLAWGRGGMLTLGQGVFFGLGAYAMAMHMQLADAQLQGEQAPGFMSTFGTELPWWWEPFRSELFTLGAVLLLPAVVAFVLGWSVFTRRVKGAYFAILNQALVFAFAVLLVGQQGTLNGSNGLSGFQSFLGFSLYDPVNRRTLYLLAAGVLILMVVIAYWLMRSRFGELLVATRDAEERVRFLGYDPALIKTTAFVVAAVMASIGGALFVPLVGIISPAEIGVVPSIAFVIGVAIGGRATLFGPVIGALAVAWVESSLAESFPSAWSYFQGLLLILVIALLPGGVASVLRVTQVRRRRRDAEDDGGSGGLHDDGAGGGSADGPETAPGDSPAGPPVAAVLGWEQKGEQ